MKKVIFFLKKKVNSELLFCSYSTWRQTSQRAPDLNRVLSSILGWLRSANNVKFTEESVLFKKCLKMG